MEHFGTDIENEIVCICDICRNEVKPTEIVWFSMYGEQYGKRSIAACYRCANAIRYATKSAIKKIRDENVNKEVAG